MRLLHRPDARETRFSARVLRSYVAAALPETLSIRAAAGDTPTEILLYDEIGYFGVSAKQFALALVSIGPGPVNVRINSPGGDSFDGLAIYNMLKARSEPVTVTIDGIAASAASIIAMAGSSISMPEQAMLMIHNCWGICIGNRNDMTEFAAVQAKIDGQMAEIYAKKSGRPIAEMASAMDGETYYTSTEARNIGLCDVILPDGQSAMALAGAKPVSVATRNIAASLPDYDPDGDGDNDAQEALTLIEAAMSLLGDAADALSGDDEQEEDEPSEAGSDDTGGENVLPVIPGASQTGEVKAAATAPEWVVGASEDLPIEASGSWDGPAAAERMLDEAGFNGDSPDPAKAKRGFLVWDHHNPKLKGSYKLPFADLVGGELKAVKSGIDAAASRLPQTDIPDDIKYRARAVIDAYEKRMGEDKKAALLAARRRRLQVAQAQS